MDFRRDKSGSLLIRSCKEALIITPKISKSHSGKRATTGFYNIDPDPFAQRLVTHLQASQYKLLKAYGSIAAQERKERLVNSITAAIRRGSHTGQPHIPRKFLGGSTRTDRRS